MEKIPETYIKRSESATSEELPTLVVESIEVLCDVFSQSKPPMSLDEVASFLGNHPALIELARQKVVNASKNDPEAGLGIDRDLAWAIVRHLNGTQFSG